MLTEKKKAQTARIRELLDLTGAEMAAHYYQRPEIKAAADYVGGSRDIFRKISQTRALTVVLCGVSFMAETIARLRPELNVLVPRRDASCPYSETVTPRTIWEIRKNDPRALIIADAKAPGEVKDLADGLMPIDLEAGYWNNKAEPGRNLYVLPGPAPSRAEGGPAGVCQVHWQLEAAQLAQAQREHPRARTAVNVLCQDEVKAMADQVGDSKTIWEFCRDSPAGEFIIAAEAGLTESLAQAFPHKIFHDPGTEIFCPNMKLTNLRDIVAVLESFQLRQALVTHFGRRSMGDRLSHDLSG
ncbi:MAG: quinolinate synthase NadA [Deltaproteobacteria bacterium]|jgi:quinolinate synthase|nr:quinolinate synthase NadA [Deltaproteobacteria bacterium]